MQIRIAHRFPVPPRAYWDGTRSPDLDDEMARESEVDVQVLERRRDGPHSFDRLRMMPRKELPGLAQRALGTQRLSYVQEVEADEAAMTTTWRVVPDVLADKVRCQGTSRVVATPEGCERIIEGEIKVAIPLVGGAVEKIVMEQIERSYERAAAVIRRHLSGA
jgi:hypothetical protein